MKTEEISILSTKFCCEPKTILKNIKSIKNKLIKRSDGKRNEECWVGRNRYLSLIKLPYIILVVVDMLLNIEF